MQPVRANVKAEICVYCCERAAITRDHVIARQFFPAPKPSNLITVPCCGQCNDEKRQLEELASVVFISHSSALGGSTAAEKLEKDRLLKRLSKRKLLREYLIDRTYEVQVPSLLSERGVTHGFSVERSRIRPLVVMITRGLIYSSYGRLVSPLTEIVADWDVDDEFLDTKGALFKTKPSTRLSLGERVFDSLHMNMRGNPEISVWLFGFYDVVYATASVGPSRWFEEAQKRSRIRQRRQQRKSRQVPKPSKHPFNRSRRK